MSAGIASIIVGFAARPTLSNLIAGLQLAITQPIRLDDAVIVENEWGWIEEIHGDLRGRAAVGLAAADRPLTSFIEKPFQNWTRESASLIGLVMLRVDFSAPIERIRAKAKELVRASIRKPCPAVARNSPPWRRKSGIGTSRPAQAILSTRVAGAREHIRVVAKRLSALRESVHTDVVWMTGWALCWGQ